MNSFTDYYTLLGIEVDAPSQAVKAAFKKLALQYHPDVYKGDDAHERMRILLQAYQTLNDPVARKHYDAQRAEYKHGIRAVPPPQATPVRPMRRSDSAVSPGARRDRQRHYDFPDLQEGQPGHIDLIESAYTLSSLDASAFVRQGMLRGVAPRTEHGSYYCHRCRHRWKETPERESRAGTLPQVCPRCHASDWTEYLLLRCVHCRAVFESEQIRYEIGAYHYGKAKLANQGTLCPPYELFPLCPYCGRARWCPAEDARVSALRLHAARKAAMLRIAWLAIAIAIIVAVGGVMLGVLR